MNTTRSLIRRTAIATSIVVTLAACGSDPAPISTPAEATEAPAEAAAVITSSSELGDILTTANGLSLYGFTNDSDGSPTCEGGCAGAWPPVIVDGAELPAGLDAAVFSVVERPDGTKQLAAGVWPLYRFAGDVTAGQTTGHLSGDVWFLAAPDGSLIDAPDSATGVGAIEEEGLQGQGENNNGY
jgi:predicted lipoprotein with Yx(FWY)xxD motif